MVVGTPKNPMSLLAVLMIADISGTLACKFNTQCAWAGIAMNQAVVPYFDTKIATPPGRYTEKSVIRH